MNHLNEQLGYNDWSSSSSVFELLSQTELLIMKMEPQHQPAVEGQTASRLAEAGFRGYELKAH